jgi:hypothetical protein
VRCLPWNRAALWGRKRRFAGRSRELTAWLYSLNCPPERGSGRGGEGPPWRVGGRIPELAATSGWHLSGIWAGTLRWHLSGTAQPVMLKTGSCSGYAVLRGEKAPDDALARELGAMGLL